jgi:isohexenylglutaconyl-CoA hydratase
MNLTDLLVETRDGVLYATLNRPDSRNALSETMLTSLQQLCEHVNTHQGELRALVLRGAGGVFCAGGDIKGFNAVLRGGRMDADAIAAANRRYGRLLDSLDRLPVAVIAAIEGAAMGGGVGLAAIADVAITTADATFSLTETTLGLPPAQIAPFVTARIGRHEARRLMLTAARLDGWQASGVGLVDESVADAAGLDEAIERMLSRIRRCAPGANAMAKALVNASGETPLTELLDHSAARFAEAMLGPEAKEGVTAFLSRRKPEWAPGTAQNPIDRS